MLCRPLPSGTTYLNHIPEMKKYNLYLTAQSEKNTIFQDFVRSSDELRLQERETQTQMMIDFNLILAKSNSFRARKCAEEATLIASKAALSEASAASAVEALEYAQDLLDKCLTVKAFVSRASKTQDLELSEIAVVMSEQAYYYAHKGLEKTRELIRTTKVYDLEAIKEIGSFF